MSKVAIGLTTGLEDPEKVTVALLVAVAAAESGRSTLIFLHQGGRAARDPWRVGRSRLRRLPVPR